MKGLRLYYLGCMVQTAQCSNEDLTYEGIETVPGIHMQSVC